MDENRLGGDAGDPGRPIDELCDLIVARHHAYLHRALPLIRAELARMADAEGPPAGTVAGTRDAFELLAQSVQAHLAKEENLLFPALEALAEADREGRARPALAFPTVLHPIRVMEAEHARIEAALDRLQGMTHAFTASDGASERWRHCLADLSRLDADLREHHRTENEVLFPRALELERRLP